MNPSGMLPGDPKLVITKFRSSIADTLWPGRRNHIHILFFVIL